MRYEPSRPNKLLTTAVISRLNPDIRHGPDVGFDHIPLLFTVAHSHVKYLDLEPRLPPVAVFRAAYWPV